MESFRLAWVTYRSNSMTLFKKKKKKKMNFLKREKDREHTYKTHFGALRGQKGAPDTLELVLQALWAAP